MTAAVPYRSAALTDVGRVRRHNEDAFLERPELGLWAVADGMGGHAYGEVASALIVEALGELAPAAGFAEGAEALLDALSTANARIRQEAEARGVALMGSTAVALLLGGRRALALWAGDSRLYRLRGGVLERLSRDHSYVQELVDAGLLTEAEAEEHPLSHVVTRSVGTAERLVVEAREFELAAGDCFLLCSDGLTRPVADAELAERLAPEEPAAAARALVALALARGGPDNVTAVVVRVL